MRNFFYFFLRLFKGTAEYRMMRGIQNCIWWSQKCLEWKVISSWEKPGSNRNQLYLIHYFLHTPSCTDEALPNIVPNAWRLCSETTGVHVRVYLHGTFEGTFLPSTLVQLCLILALSLLEKNSSFERAIDISKCLCLWLAGSLLLFLLLLLLFLRLLFLLLFF